jgi:hypothetical protein
MGRGNERGSHYHGDSAARESETTVAWERFSFRVAFCSLSGHRCGVSSNHSSAVGRTHSTDTESPQPAATFISAALLSAEHRPRCIRYVPSALRTPRPKRLNRVCQDLVRVSPEQLRRSGYSRQKCRAILDLAHACVDRTIDLEALSDLNDADAVTRLLELRGVGRWTAEYVFLRGLGRTHIFPGDDVGARNNLQRWLGRISLWLFLW